MALYPQLPKFLNIVNTEVRDMYEEIQRWGSILINELDNRDEQERVTPSTNVLVVTTVTTLKRPKKGDIAYSASAGKFKGYVSSGSTTEWQNLN
tara:strand:+ start:819 stop:1100 length:282 start_codon:yes stop_codon:yes gene_type:complete